MLPSSASVPCRKYFETKKLYLGRESKVPLNTKKELSELNCMERDLFKEGQIILTANDKAKINFITIKDFSKRKL